MSRFALATILAATLAPVLSASDNATLVLQQVTVRDPMVNNIVAGSILKPEGWKFSGGVKWHPNSYHQADFEAVINNPNTHEQLEFLPITYCAHFRNPVMPIPRLSNYQGQIVLEPMAPQKLVTEFTLPGFRKISPQSVKHFDMPELARLCQMKAGGGKWKASRTRVTYTKNGAALEEDFYVACFYYDEVSLGVNNATATFWGVGLAFALRADQGQLDEATPRMLAMVHSLKGNAEHMKQVLYVRSLFSKRMYDQIGDAKTISDQISANNDHAIKLMREARATQDAAYTRTSRNFSDYIRGTQEYTADGFSYSLPSGYQQAWVNTNGTVILSNQAGFDPNTTNSGTWSELKQAR